jgi:hypothetical protein
MIYLIVHKYGHHKLFRVGFTSPYHRHIFLMILLLLLFYGLVVDSWDEIWIKLRLEEIVEVSSCCPERLLGGREIIVGLF